MTTKKPTDLKSVSLGQINDLEDRTVVGGGDAPVESASKNRKDARKMESDDAKKAKDIEKVIRDQEGSTKIGA